MSCSQFVSIAVIGMAAVTIVAFALAGMPYFALLIFRARLARIHDDAIDAILAGQLRNISAVTAFLGSLTAAGAQVSVSGLLHNAFAPLNHSHFRVSLSTAQSFSIEVADLNPFERKLMREFGTRACYALQSFAIAASPIGWLIAPIALLARRLGPTRRPAHARGYAIAACDMRLDPAKVRGKASSTGEASVYGSQYNLASPGRRLNTDQAVAQNRRENVKIPQQTSGNLHEVWEIIKTLN